MTDKYILGNWKMNGSAQEAQALARSIAGIPAVKNVHIAIFPPFTLLSLAQETIQGSEVALGAQDISAEEKGAFTGEISAFMLKDAGCTYVLCGHSERRQLHGETNELVKRKADAALKAGLVPVICVGETLAERESGNYLKIIADQTRASLPVQEHSDRFIIAYEPVWAIGSGKTPTPAQISEVHKTIASLLTYGKSGARTAIVYGGSVKAAGAHEILNAQGVDGVLVGGASLKYEEFAAIIAQAT